MSSIISLSDRHTDATRELILNTAIGLLEKSGVTELTVRAIAKQAGMSERTVFRYYATRDELLDAVAAEAARLMQVPPPPESIKELLDFPDSLYRCFDGSASLVEATLHTDIFRRVRAESAPRRWHAVAALIDEKAPHRSKKERTVAATNINYYLSATTWHYYRSQFELTLDETINCAKTAIRLIVDDIVKKPKK